MANLAEKNAMQVSFVEEATRATIPADGLVLRKLPIQEGCRASMLRNVERSATLRADRQGGKQVGGTRSAQATTVHPMTTDLGISNLIRLAMQGAAFTAVATEIAGYDFTNAGAGTRKTWTLDFLYDVGTGSPLVERLIAAEINRLTLNVPTSGGASLSVDWVAQDLIPAGGDGFGDTTPTYTNASEDNPMAGSAEGAELGTSLTLGADLVDGFTNFSLVINNGIEPLYAIGRADAYHIGRSDFDVEANFDVYLEDFSILSKYVNGTRETLRIKLVEDGTAGAKACNWVIRRGVYTANEKGDQGPAITQRCRIFGEVNNAAPATKLSYFVDGMSV